jgi:hypothetical protein
MNDSRGFQACTITKGTWVEVERVLSPEPARTPHVLRVSGFLEEDAILGQQVTIRTIIGNHHTGKLRIENPGYGHSFGHTVPELLKLGRGGLA